MQYFQLLNYNNSPVKVVATDTVQQVAQQMTDHLTTGAIISADNTPIGIVTNTDNVFQNCHGKIFNHDHHRQNDAHRRW